MPGLRWTISWGLKALVRARAPGRVTNFVSSAREFVSFPGFAGVKALWIAPRKRVAVAAIFVGARFFGRKGVGVGGEAFSRPQEGFLRAQRASPLSGVFFARGAGGPLPRPKQDVRSVVVTPLHKLDPIRFDQIYTAMLLRDAARPDI